MCAGGTGGGGWVVSQRWTDEETSKTRRDFLEDSLRLTEREREREKERETDREREISCERLKNVSTTICDVFASKACCRQKANWWSLVWNNWWTWVHSFLYKKRNIDRASKMEPFTLSIMSDETLVISCPDQFILVNKPKDTSLSRTANYVSGETISNWWMTCLNKKQESMYRIPNLCSALEETEPTVVVQLKINPQVWNLPWRNKFSSC